MKAIQIVHWPGKDTPACEEHAQKLYALARTMGFPLSSSINIGEVIECTNCINEAKK